MHLTIEQQKELERFPSPLRALVEAELAAGNTVVEVGHSHPAPPAGAYFKLARKVSTRARASGDGLDFYERNSSSHAGEFTDAKRFYFVLEPASPLPPEPDMDAIRKAREPKPESMGRRASADAERREETAGDEASREGTGAQPPRTAKSPGEPCPQHGKATVDAQSYPDAVAAVQRAILDGLRRGATFGTSHKEGGTNIYWRNGRFIRNDYGDYPGVREFTDEGEFLKMLRQFCHFEVTRSAGKEPLSELEVWRLILRWMRPVAPPPAEPLGGGAGPTQSVALVGVAALPPTIGATPMRPLYSTPFALGLAIGLLVLLAAGLVAWRFVSIPSTGLPLGPAVRTPTHVLQLIHTTERYLARLHRNPDRDRFRLDLMVISIAEPTRPEIFTLLRQQQRNVVQPMTKILGAEGDVVWIQALDILAVNLQTKRVLRTADLRKLNPELALFLHSARAEFTDRFVAVSPDGHQAYAFSTETFKATPCPPPPRGTWMDERFKNPVEGSLCSGGLLTSADWFGALTPAEATKDFKPGSSMPRDFAWNPKDEMRRLYRCRIDTTAARPRIEQTELIAETAYRGAALIRTSTGGAVLRLPEPDSVLLLHRTGTELSAPFTLTRMTPDSKPVWSAATGIGRLQQVLPDPTTIALIGERPPIPDQVPEPILVLINAKSGETRTLSLWRRR